ncbi:unconventional myosin-XV-like isoform X2 [Ornithodoros turicata]|uniref:unconventional myosin-XV-like isoform X2 n=1 Tax=Ornithodoros turicata TaxID=34597 RepID=UPI0031399B84
MASPTRPPDTPTGAATPPVEDFQPGDLVWFDPGVGYSLPGEVVEFSRPAQVVTVQAMVSGKPQSFTIHKPHTVKRREDLGPNGVPDMVQLGDLSEASMLWNLKIRYDHENIYTYTGSILVAVNPYKMFDIYGVDVVKKYEGQILGTLPPHLFAVSSAAYSKMSKELENQVVVISGESGAGKTESTKLILQYLAAVDRSSNNLVTEQILEATPLLESFGNAKTLRNDNSSRFGKYLEVFFKDGVITGANTKNYLLEKSRIVTQASEERNYHVFYELLVGLGAQEKEKFGLQTADKYFYLNQGGSIEIPCKDDAEDFRCLLSAMQVLGFTADEQDAIFRILAAVLHIGNVYFHRKPLKHGQEGVEVGSEAEIRWVSHLLQISPEGILDALTTKATEARNERMVTALNIDQALDARDAVAKALYSSLFSWLVRRINEIVCHGQRKTSLAILDIFGFEDLKDNSLEQLCINYANETLQHHFNKQVFKLEQAEYTRERLEWQPLPFTDNQAVLALLAKKPLGILPLLDDESNFPRATDLSFLEKCHYNHALDELYSRPRMSSLEFGIRHYAGQVWYTVDSFLDKNRDTLRADVVDLLVSSKLQLVSEMFRRRRAFTEASRMASKADGRFVTMKPRAPTVAARFCDSLHGLIDAMNQCHPWFVRCLKPNREKAPMKLDMALVLEQLRYSGMLDTIRIRKLGFPVRYKFAVFADRYRCLVPGLAATSSRDVCRAVLERTPGSQDGYQLGTSKVFLKETVEQTLDQERVAVLRSAIVVLQRHVRGYLARRHYRAMRKAARRIQTAYRGYAARSRYRKVRRGVIKAQANYRMLRQKREYDKIKAILARKREADRLALERAKERAARDQQERAARAVAGVNHLEIPAELAFIFTKLDEWQSPHNDRNVTKASPSVSRPRTSTPGLPSDVDQHVFTKFTNIYFKSHLWGMKREPIRTPFLAKASGSQHQDSLALFKLILRFMNDSHLSGQRERVLGDYIVQRGLREATMRDELLCQLCNQTWQNDNAANCQRGWLLMANCLSAFPPSSTLYKYLLKYVSDHGQEGYAAYCQQQLLRQNGLGPEDARTYPPCLLEWKANTRKMQMALEAQFPDEREGLGAVDSWTTGEEFAAELLHARGVDDAYGWTTELLDEGATYSLNGTDYVLDLIAETEVPPAFPVCKSYFLVSHSGGPGEPPSSNSALASPHRPDRVETYEVELHDLPPAPPQRVSSNSAPTEGRSPQASAAAPSTRPQRGAIPVPPPVVPDAAAVTSSPSRRSNESQNQQRRQVREFVHETRTGCLTVEGSLDRREPRSSPALTNRTRSLEDLLDGGPPDGALSKQSALNGRYFEGSRPPSKGRISTPQYLPSGRDSAAAPESSATSSSSAWQRRMGLSSSALNERYFQVAPSASETASELLLGESGRDDHSERTDSPSLDGLDFPELDLGDTDSAVGYSRGEQQRYIKYAGTRPPRRGAAHSSRAHIDRTRDLSDYGGARSSALSDTSEAPSLASHVKNVRIPSHTSDLDQYLDELFNPVLDGNLDEMSDARSLAASLKGEDLGLDDAVDMAQRLKGDGKPAGNTTMTANVPQTNGGLQGANLSMLNMASLNAGLLSPQLLGMGPVQSPTGVTPPPAGMTVPIVDASQLIQQQVLQQHMMQLQQRAFLANAVQQNLQIQQQLMQQSAALQQLLQSSVVPQGTSPQPGSNGTSGGLLSPTGTSPDPRLLASTGGLTSPLAPLSLAIPGVTPDLSWKPPDAGQKASKKNGQPSPKDTFGNVLSELRHKAGTAPENGIPPPPPMPPLSPNTMAKYPDVYGRAKTVRIGKWRWPPPRDEAGNFLPGQPTSFLEFKRLKQQEREERRAAGLAFDSSDEDDDERDFVDFPEIQGMETALGGKPENATVAKGIPVPTTPAPTSSSSPANDSRRSKEDLIRAFEGEVRPGSIGKIRISSEMKAKLEQLTIDHSVRSKTSTHKESRGRILPAPKLDEDRKRALEKQLGGWNELDSSVPALPSAIPPPPPSESVGTRSFRVDNLVKSKIEKMERQASREPASPVEPPSAPRPTKGGPTPSVAASSSCYAPNTPVVARHRVMPPPIQPAQLLDRLSGKSETIEFDECPEFLKPVDSAPPPTVPTRSGARAVDSLKTKLFPSSVAPYLTYTKVPWRLRIRKEVFTPGEMLDNANLLHLVFSQIMQDVYADACVRLTPDENKTLRALLVSLSVTPSNAQGPSVTLQTKRQVVEAARALPLYFSRIFPASGGRQLPDVQMLAVSHTGVRLVKRQRDANGDSLCVLDTLGFEDIADVTVPRPSTVNILLRNGGWMTIYSPKATQIKSMIHKFVVECTQDAPEYLRAVADYVTTESTLLSFRKGEIVRLVKHRSLNLPKGWLYGVTESGESGLFPCEYVVPLGRQSQDGAHHTPTHQNESRVSQRPSGQHVERLVDGAVSSPILASSAWIESKDDHGDEEEEVGEEADRRATELADGKHSMLQFAMFNFRESLDRYELLRQRDGSIRGSVKMIEHLKATRGGKGRKAKDSDWTWKELVEMIKFSKSPIQSALLNLESPELNKMATESFLAVMRYMGDYPLAKNQSEVDCVYSILVSCHKHPALRDEVYCQIIKQTTNNKSSKPDSCQRGWRLFSIIAAYFDCSENLKPYLFKFLETAAYDKRRAYHGTAMVCLQNLRKTFKYGGRKNVPSIEEIAAISAGRNSKRQIYRLPGGTERVINTKSTTVVEDIIDEICTILGVRSAIEAEEFSLYCIVEGDPFTMPLSREEYILDVTTELIKNGHVFYLIFCRSVWFFPLRLDNALYVEVIFNQVAPDYLEGLLLVAPRGRPIPDNVVNDMARIAALLHRAADMQHVPSKDEVKYLLPKPVLAMKDIRPPQWVDMVQYSWPDMMALTNTEAKAQCLDILQRWPLFGSCFFAVKWIRTENNQAEHILALNREGIHFLDVASHESVWMYPFSEVISTRKVRAEDGTLFLDMKCGNLMVQKITRIQTDQAHEVSRLVRQYINIQQNQQGTQQGDAPRDVTLSRNLK